MPCSVALCNGFQGGYVRPHTGYRTLYLSSLRMQDTMLFGSKVVARSTNLTQWVQVHGLFEAPPCPTGSCDFSEAPVVFPASPAATGRLFDLVRLPKLNLYTLINCDCAGSRSLGGFVFFLRLPRWGGDVEAALRCTRTKSDRLQLGESSTRRTTSMLSNELADKN